MRRFKKKKKSKKTKDEIRPDWVPPPSKPIDIPKKNKSQQQFISAYINTSSLIWKC